MNLRKFEGENVRIVCTDDEVFEGYASIYIFADDNEPEVEAIVLDCPIRKSDGYKLPNLTEFTAPEIKSIEVIE